MAQPGTVRVKGYRETMRVLNKAEKDTKKIFHAKLREAGGIVADEARKRFDRYDSKTASGFSITSRVGGVFVVQSLRKVTGRRPDYARLQMRKALEPALDAKSAEVERKLEQALDEIADIVDRK